MKGRAALFSALTAVLTRPLLMDGVKAEADPARRAAARARDLTMVDSFISAITTVPEGGRERR